MSGLPEDAPSDRTGVDPLPVDPDGLVCSAAGCTNAAVADLQWNNPKIHPEDRRKHWLACPHHQDALIQYLSRRGLFRSVEALPRSHQPGS